MRVSADAAVCDHIRARGGVLWVRSTTQRCCHGALTSLRSRTTKPKDAGGYETVECDLPFTVRFLGASGPDEMVVELRGLVRKRPEAFWDGCRFKP